MITLDEKKLEITIGEFISFNYVMMVFEEQIVESLKDYYMYQKEYFAKTGRYENDEVDEDDMNEILNIIGLKKEDLTADEKLHLMKEIKERLNYMDYCGYERLDSDKAVRSGIAFFLCDKYGIDIEDFIDVNEN